jgi:hypothetical protein
MEVSGMTFLCFIVCVVNICLAGSAGPMRGPDRLLEGPGRGT